MVSARMTRLQPCFTTLKALGFRTGLQAIAEAGREKLREHQSPAEASDAGGEPQAREELVESEYGGGQDTEPLRPASAGRKYLQTSRIL